MDKFDIAKGFMDQIKFYINPEIYKQELGTPTLEQEFSHMKNMIGEDTFEMARRTGNFKLPKNVQEIIDKTTQKVSDDEREYYWIDKDGEMQQINKSDSSFEEEGLLG